MSDLTQALRSLLKAPGFAAVAILTLALGIGLNSAMFSLMNGLMLRPLPFHDAENLVRLQRTTPRDSQGTLAPADYFDLKREEASFGTFAAFRSWGMTLANPGQPVEWHEALLITPEFLGVLGVHPVLGRPFRPEEGLEGNHRVVLLSHTLWQERFAGSRDVLGRTLPCNGEPHEIVGVLPPAATDHRLFGRVGFFAPLPVSATTRTDRTSRNLSVLGRRNPTVTASEGEAFIAVMGARMASDFPAVNAESGWRTENLQTTSVSPQGRVMLFMVLGLSGFVLLIACSNLANLQLARAIERAREFAVRSALGGSRIQIIRPLLAESLILASAGVAAALLVTSATSRWLSSVIFAGGGPAFDLPLDVRVLGFSLGASLLTVLAFTLAPALFTVRINTPNTLKIGSRGATAGRGHQRFRHGLIIGQFTLATILVAGALFLVHGVRTALSQPHGWSAKDVAQASVQLPAHRYADAEAINAFHRRALEHLRQLPGVDAACLAYSLPFLGMRDAAPYLVENQERPSPGREPFAKINGVSPGYFAVTGTRLIAGRDFRETDSLDTPRVAILNETAARTLFPNQNPIGQRIARAGSGDPAWIEIIGVAPDVQPVDIAQRPAPLQIYHPMAQEPRYASVLAVRTRGIAPEAILESIRSTLAQLDPDAPARELVTAETGMKIITSQMHLFRSLLTAFAVLGLLLAALGLYGVIARSVVQRTSEIGVRMALGAQTRDILRLILGSGLRLATVGAALGLFGAFALSRLIASILPSMQIHASLTLVAATILLLAIALTACYLPSRRASRIHPSVALRAD